MFEQLAHLLLLPGGLAGLGSLGLAGSAARLLGNAVAEFLAGCGQGVQHRLGNFLDDVELTDLMAWFKTPTIRVTVLPLSTGVGSCSGFCQPRSGAIS